jgi:hypothetical protein
VFEPHPLYRTPQGAAQVHEEVARSEAEHGRNMGASKAGSDVPRVGEQ